MVHDHPHKHSVSVSAIIFNDKGEVLATRRRDTGAWVPPGGVLHLHEPIEDGLHREVMEETGLEIEIERLTGVYKNTATGVLSLAFRCRPSTHLAPRTSDETAIVRWMTAAEAKSRMTAPFTTRVNDAKRDGPPRIMNIIHHNIMAAKSGVLS